MLRSVGPEALASLRAAATQDDATLDLALLRLGILAPADLNEIRVLLTLPASSLRAATNRDGHRIIEIVERDRLIAQVHHDGRVFVCVAAGTAA